MSKYHFTQTLAQFNQCHQHGDAVITWHNMQYLQPKRSWQVYVYYLARFFNSLLIYMPFVSFPNVPKNITWDRDKKRISWRIHTEKPFVYQYPSHSPDSIVVVDGAAILYYEYGKQQILLKLDDDLCLITPKEIQQVIRKFAQTIATELGITMIDETQTLQAA